MMNGAIFVNLFDELITFDFPLNNQVNERTVEK